MSERTNFRQGLARFFFALGPAFIVASVVLGPGSILASSKVGAQYGFSMVWVLLMAAFLMMVMVALAGRLGVVLSGTMCDELASRVGRPFAALIGLTIFFICAGFQFGNNLGVLASLQPWLEKASEESQVTLPFSHLLLLLLNAMIIIFLFGFRNLYVLIERLMMFFVGLMILGFFGNLIYLVVTKLFFLSDLPPKTATVEPAGDPAALYGLIGTTFSVAGAFYQAYLVREKGWTLGDAKRGMIDSVAGITVLCLISLVVMTTAALSFHGRAVSLISVADVASQLQPLFGNAAVILFSLGIFAGAFSSFLVNAMIGGAMLSDGLGFGGKMDSLSTRLFTTVVLVIGMLVALFVSPDQRVGVIIFAQAMVVIGFPLLAFSMLYLALDPRLQKKGAIPLWMKIGAAAGALFTLAIAYNVFMKLVHSN